MKKIKKNTITLNLAQPCAKWNGSADQNIIFGVSRKTFTKNFQAFYHDTPFKSSSSAI